MRILDKIKNVPTVTSKQELKSVVGQNKKEFNVTGEFAVKLNKTIEQGKKLSTRKKAIAVKASKKLAQTGGKAVVKKVAVKGGGELGKIALRDTAIKSVALTASEFVPVLDVISLVPMSLDVYKTIRNEKIRKTCKLVSEYDVIKDSRDGCTLHFKHK